MKLNIKKEKGVYKLFVEDPTGSSLINHFIPLKFSERRIGLGISSNGVLKNDIQLGKNTGISGTLITDKGITINNNNINSDTTIKGTTDNNLLFLDSSKDVIGIGTNVPNEKLTIRGEVYAYNDSSNLGAEILNDGNFSSSSNWDLHMGGFTIETEATTGNKYLLFTHPTSLTYFDVPNPNEPFEILNNPNFTIGQTAATAAQSLYKWYLAGDVSISPSDNGGTVTFEHSSGSATLQQKIINKTALPAASGAAGKVWLKFTYTITESNIVSGFEENDTLPDSGTVQTKLILYSTILNSISLNTDVGTHTTFTRASSVYTVTAGTLQDFLIAGVSLTAGDKVVMKDFSLTEVAGVLDQRTAAMATAGDIDAGEKYKFTYNLTDLSGATTIILGTTWLNGLFRGKTLIPPVASSTKTMTGKVTATNGSTSVTGTDTAFLKEVSVGDLLYTSDRTSKIGIVSSITNNKTLVLTANFGGSTTADMTNVIIETPSSVIHSHGSTDGGYFDLLVTNSNKGNSFRLDDISLKKIQSSFRTEDGNFYTGGNIEIGSGAAGVDYTLTFDGETNDGVITWLEDENYFKFSKDVSAGWHGDADMIKILPRDFLGNEDVANGFVQYDDTGTVGVSVTQANTELNCFVPIPFGKKATHVDIFASSALAITVFEGDLTDGGVSTKGTGNANTTLDITDVSWGADTYLGIRVVTTATSDIVYGGKVTIADIV